MPKRGTNNLPKTIQRPKAGVKAQGALRRLTLTGNKLQLAGKTLYQKDLSSAQYNGKVLLVVFWASYAQPFTADLPAIQDCLCKYNKDGFEILGVNMDGDFSTLPAYLKQHGITWQSLREAPKENGMQPGDFGYGIVSVPTMFLVNKQGIVEGGITTANLDFAVDALLKGKKLESIPGPGGRNSCRAPKIQRRKSRKSSTELSPRRQSPIHSPASDRCRAFLLTIARGKQPKIADSFFWFVRIE